MPNFAIVIGIDNYLNNPRWNLNGAVTDALAFLEWAHGPGGVPNDATHTRLLLSPQDPGVTDLPYIPATNENIIQTIADFQDGAGKEGGRLYVYFAGHGVSAPGLRRDAPAEPVIIPADVASTRYNAGLLIPFSELITALAEAPPMEQFFFIDACRDFVLDEHRATISPAPVRWIPAIGEENQSTAQYVLYATSPGQRAYEEGRGAFGQALVEALRGAGAAKVWAQPPPRYDIPFSRLVRFVGRHVEETIKLLAQEDAAKYIQIPQPELLGKAKVTDAVLAAIPSGQEEQLAIRVRVTPREAREKGQVTVVYHLPGGKESPIASQPPPALGFPAYFNLSPGDYTFVAGADQYQEQRLTHAAYEPTVLDFPLVPVTGPPPAPSPAPAGGPPGPGSLEVSSLDPSVAIIVRDSHLGLLPGGVGSGWVRLESLTPGIYRVQSGAADGRLEEQTVEVRSGERTYVPLTADATRLRVGADQEQMLSDLGIMPSAEGFLHPSEYLPPIADATLASLLGFAAFAAHWPDGGFHRLRSFGVTPMQNVPPGEAGLLVLTGVAGEEPAPGMNPTQFLTSGHLEARTLSGDYLDEAGFAPLSGFSAAAQRQTRVPIGPLDLELHLPELAPTHYALVGLPDRVTTLVLVANADGGFDVQQYLIPLRAPDYGPGPSVMDNPANIRRIELAQRYYSSTRDIPLDENIDLLYGKWLDPLLGCLAGYALIRRGRAEEYVGHPNPNADPRQLEPSAMRNMLKFFPELPDSHVLAALAEPERRAEHFANALSRGLPIFADGFRAFSDWYQGDLPPIFVDAAHGLLPASTWTAWTNVAPPDESAIPVST
jgi:hypothetical protein